MLHSAIATVQRLTYTVNVVLIMRKPTCTNVDVLRYAYMYAYTFTQHFYVYVCYVAYSLGADSSLFLATAVSINL